MFFGQHILVNVFVEVSKNGFLPVFFVICLQRRKLYQNRVIIVFCESSEKQFVRSNKKVDKIFDLFLKILDPPLSASD